ncbi:hypothetical protein BC829DRAFT_398730 [Chytridium lagenaria]|nr:hypothetical protein BC829DRAFT_398730 [Chytridium lagenaria]
MMVQQMGSLCPPAVARSISEMKVGGGEKRGRPRAYSAIDVVRYVSKVGLAIVSPVKAVEQTVVNVPDVDEGRGLEEVKEGVIKAENGERGAPRSRQTSQQRDQGRVGKEVAKALPRLSTLPPPPASVSSAVVAAKEATVTMPKESTVPTLQNDFETMTENIPHSLLDVAYSVGRNGLDWVNMFCAKNTDKSPEPWPTAPKLSDCASSPSTSTPVDGTSPSTTSTYTTASPYTPPTSRPSVPLPHGSIAKARRDSESSTATLLNDDTESPVSVKSFVSSASSTSLGGEKKRAGRLATWASWGVAGALGAAATAVSTADTIASVFITEKTPDTTEKSSSSLLKYRDLVVSSAMTAAAIASDVASTWNVAAYLPAILRSRLALFDSDFDPVTASDDVLSSRYASLSSFSHLIACGGSSVRCPPSFSFDAGRAMMSVNGSAAWTSMLKEVEYAVGVAKEIRETLREEVLDGARYLGSSFGAVVALEAVVELARRMEEFSQNRLLYGAGSMSHMLRDGLEELIPEDISVIKSDRVFISVTRLATLENDVISEFQSKETLIEALMATLCIPIVYEQVVQDGELIVSGFFSNPLPQYDGLTVTVSARPGGANISPGRKAFSQTLYERGYAVAPNRKTANRISENRMSENRMSENKGTDDARNWFSTVLESGNLTLLALKRPFGIEREEKVASQSRPRFFFLMGS